MVEAHTDAVTTICECRERKVRGDDNTNRLDSLIDDGQGVEFRVGRGIVKADVTGRSTRCRGAGARHLQLHPLHFGMKEQSE